MSAQRKAIRQSLAAILKNAATAAGDRVFSSRSTPIFESELPAILVYTRSESVELFAESPREYKRTVTVVIEAVAETTGENLDDQLDDVGQEIEAALAVDHTAGDTVSELTLSGSDLLVDRDGEKYQGAVKLEYQAIYYTCADEDSGDLGNLGTSNIDYDLGPDPNGAIDATDLLTHEQA